MTPASCRLHVLLASRSTKAVVIRRGPSKQACLVAWDRRKDTFQVGQWFKGRIYEDRCDLSEDGLLMVAFLASQRPPFGTWTVLCRPPYLTALALWPNGTTHGGGGRFVGPRRLALFGNPATLAPGFRVPGELEVTDSIEALPRASTPAHAPEAGGDPAIRKGPEGYVLGGGGEGRLLDGVSWAARDANGDLLLATGGHILRVPAGRIPRDAGIEELRDRGRVLVDLTELRFRPLAAPYETPRPPMAVIVPGKPPLDGVTREDRRERVRLRKERLRLGPG